jgi:gluconolactonase
LNYLKSFSIYIFILTLVFFSFENIFAQSPVPADAKLETLKTGFLQPEGPVWVDSLGLLFSDIQANKIYRWSPVDSSLTVFLSPSDSSNGLTLDLQGHLILTQMEKRRVSRRETDGTITPLASTYNGKKFNSPNDVVVKSDGSIFFTDPDFNIPTGQAKELTFQGIYRISPSGTLSLLDASLNKPNGICFSPDEKKLYVDESAKDSIYVWDVVNDSTIANKKPFFGILLLGYNDGMKVDSVGNIYCAAPMSVWVISPSGTKLAEITMPVTPSNCAWGDTDRKTLYITGGSSLYRIRLATATTGVKDQSSLCSQTIELHNNYPNPFNPSTTISYTLPEKSSVNVTIYDIQGKAVKSFSFSAQSAGSQSVVWNGTNNHGNVVSSGVYMYRVIVSSLKDGSRLSKSAKMMFLK